MNLKSAFLAITVMVLSMPIGLKAQHSHAGVAGSGSYRTHGAGSVPAARPAIPRGTGPYGLRTDIPTPVGLNPPAASYTGILPGAFKSANGAGRYGRGGVGGFIGAPLYLPYLGYDPSLNTFPSYDQTVDPNAQAYGMMQDALGEQIRQLTAEVDSMKRQMNTPPAASYAPPAVPQAPAAMAPAAQDEGTTSHPSIAVVLKNGQRMSIQSYAIMNGFLWDFSKQPVRKIPVSNIDIPESTKATEANGTEFPDLSSASRVSVSH